MITIGQLVCTGAAINCSFGMMPSTLISLPTHQVNSKTPAATIMDHKPMVNIVPFGLCTSMSNPTVISATAAALGVLTPQPCVPVTTTPWVPGSSTVVIGNMPALNNTCSCTCQWGGVIKIANAGQTSVNIP